MEKGIIPRCVDDIPAELLAKVFSCLPVHRILQLRCVNKRWNSIVSSHSTFPLLWSKHSQTYPPWIIMYSSCDSVAAFNPCSARWMTFSIPSPPVASLSKRIVASAGGLLCVYVSCESARCLLVCNPITKHFRVLPELPLEAKNFLTVMSADENGRYKIFIVESLDNDGLAEGGPLAAFYCSLEGLWHSLDVRDMFSIKGCGGDNTAFYAGMVVTVSKVGPPHQLTMYNSVQQVATNIQLPFEHSMSLYPPLCVCNNRLVLAGGVWEYLPFSSFNLWELEHLSRKLIQMVSLPCATLDDSQIAPLPANMLEQLGSGDYLFFHARILVCPVIYDVKNKSWLCMPRYHGPCKAWVPSIMYDPSFAARV